MAGNEIATDKPEEKKPENSNWLADNIAHPFANAAALEPWNAVASVVNSIHKDTLPEVQLYNVPKDENGLGWLTQSVSAGVGGLVPFVVAGKLTGGAMRGSGRMLESAGYIESSGLAAKALTSSRLAMVAGAGLYGAAEKPGDGQTRLGNSVASVVGFGAFELGGKFSEGTPIISLAGIRNRALVGFAGGSLSSMSGNLTNSWLTTGHASIGDANSIIKAGVSGAALNILLPIAQDGATRGLDSIRLKAGLSIPAQNYAAREGWSQNEPLKQLIDQSPLTNVKATDGDPRIDQSRNIVDMGNKNEAPLLGHEIAHRIRLKADEAKFQDAASHLDESKPETYNPELARQKFIDLRVAQEQTAREVQNRVAGNDARVTDPNSFLDSKASDVVTYRQKFAAEADQFVEAKGKFRPQEDNHGHIEGDNNYGINQETGLMEQEYPQPKQMEYGLTSKYEESPDGKFKRYTIVNEDGVPQKVVEVHDEPVPTQYGTAQRTDLLPNGGARLYIIDGKDPIPDNSTVEVYEEKGGLDTKLFGRIRMKITDSDGMISYRKADGTYGYEYPKPKSLYDDGEDPKYSALDVQADRMIYHLEGGGTNEYYPEGMQTHIVKADGSTEPIQVESILREPNGKTSYVLPDTSQIVVENTGSGLSATRYDMNLNPIEKFAPKQMTEQHPAGISVNIGDATLSNVNAVERRFDSTVYRSKNSITQVYDADHALSTKYGDVKRVDYLANEFKKYFKDDGSRVLVNPQGIKSPYGVMEATEERPDHTNLYYRYNGDVVHEYPSDINAVAGEQLSGLFGDKDGRFPIASSEQVPHGLVLRARDTGNPWYAAYFDFANHTVTTYDTADNLIGSRGIPTGFRLFRQFPPQNYPDGVMWDHGPLRMIETDDTGKNTYRTTDGQIYKDKEKDT